MLGYVIAVLFGLAFTSMFGSGIYYRWRAREEWERFADAHGFRFERPSLFGRFEIHGMHRGESVAVENDGPMGQTNATRMTVELPSSVPPGLVLVGRELGARILEMFRSNHTEVGRSELESSYFIRGGPEGDLRTYLDRDPVVEALVELRENTSTVRLEDRELKVIDPGLRWDADKMTEDLEAIVQCAEALEDAGDPGTTEPTDTSEDASTDESEREPEPVTEW